MEVMVSIRPIEEDDAEAVQTLASDAAIAATTTLPHPYPPDGAREFIHMAIGQRDAGTDFVFALLADEVFVGICSLHGVGGNPLRAELGYWVGKPYWGRGHGAAGAAQVVRWGFENLPVDFLTGRCLERNAASARILEKLGFAVCAKEPNTNPKWLPADVIVRYELSRAEWMQGG
jgi:RimJ/RimL family protein N-acetyltransferase